METGELPCVPVLCIDDALVDRGWTVEPVPTVVVLLFVEINNVLNTVVLVVDFTKVLVEPDVAVLDLLLNKVEALVAAVTVGVAVGCILFISCFINEDKSFSSFLMRSPRLVSGESAV